MTNALPLNKPTYLLFAALMVFGCGERNIREKQKPLESRFNQTLADELARMAKTDQIAAYIPQGEHKLWSKEQWNSFKDSVFSTHQARLDEIFEEHGYPGYDLVGEQGAENFWIMTQHADHMPQFQLKVLQKMREEVERDNADPKKYGFLADRININLGNAQRYGTQVGYNTEICQAYPLNLADSTLVNQRRASIGLPPLEEYLNQLSEIHFEMNRENYLNRGITAPRLY